MRGENMTGFAEEFDYVVVGSGGGSMVAALVMRAAGKSVLILEKTDLVGGTTARSGGVMWIPNNRFMRRDGVPDSYESAALYLDSLVGDQEDAPGATRERRHAYVAQAPEMLEFLISKGMKFTRVRHWPDYYDELPGGSRDGRGVCPVLYNANELGPWKKKLRRGRFAKYPASHEELFKLTTIKRSWSARLLAIKVALRKTLSVLTRGDLVGAGSALQGRMLQACVREGVDIRTDSSVIELVVEDGAVKAVVTVKDAKPWRIGARLGVLINAGGFARNQAMRDKYQPGTSVDWTLTGPGDTGEMIEEMMRHGAWIAQMEEMVGLQQTIPPGMEKADVKPGAQSLTASPHAILVDRTGVRYMNEGGSYMAYCKGMLERSKVAPAVPSWAIFDSQCMSTYMVAGSLPGAPKPSNWYSSGYLNKAETIEGLADKLGIDHATLKSTVDRFNTFVAQNHDADFGRGDRAYDRWLGDPFNKPSETLGSIDKGPFYAVPVVPGDVGTYGGVVTDVSARVLRKDGSVIPGLYATGISTASVMGRFYPGSGGSVGPSFVWGYVAARSALGNA